MSFRFSTLLLLTLFSIFGRLAHAAEITPGGCVNAACEYVVNLAATCQDRPTEQTSDSPNTCLCTQRFEVNLARCLRGHVCEWDGTSDPGAGACPDLYCPGTFDEAFISQCPNSAPATGTPGPRPITVTTPLPSALPSAGSGNTTPSAGSGNTTPGGNTNGTGTGTTTQTTETNAPPASNTPSLGTKLAMDRVTALLATTLLAALGMIMIH